MGSTKMADDPPQMSYGEIPLSNASHKRTHQKSLAIQKIENPFLITTPAPTTTNGLCYQPTALGLFASIPSWTTNGYKNCYNLNPSSTYLPAFLPTVSMNSLAMLSSSSQPLSNYTSHATYASNTIPTFYTELTAQPSNRLHQAAISSHSSPEYHTAATHNEDHNSNASSQVFSYDEDDEDADDEASNGKTHHDDQFSTPVKETPESAFAIFNELNKFVDQHFSNLDRPIDDHNSLERQNPLLTPPQRTIPSINLNDEQSNPSTSHDFSNLTSSQQHYDACDVIESPTPLNANLELPSNDVRSEQFQAQYHLEPFMSTSTGNPNPNLWSTQFFASLQQDHINNTFLTPAQFQSQPPNPHSFSRHANVITDSSSSSQYSSSPSISKEASPIPYLNDSTGLASYLPINSNAPLLLPACYDSFPVGHPHPQFHGIDYLDHQIRYQTHKKSSLVDRTSTAKYFCPQCGKGHSRQSNLSAHLRDTHSNEKKVFCDVEGCSKAYKRVSECRRHKKDMHGIPLPSELAGKTRKTRRILNPF